MTLTDEQIAEAKKQLSEQIAHLPDDQKAQAQQQIDSMSPEAIEKMVAEQAQGNSQQVFRLIVQGKIPAKVIADIDDAIAVLSTKSISKGHSVIIPKTAVTKSSDMPASVFELAKVISAKVIEVLQAHGSEIQTQFAFGELVVHVIPVFDKPVSINSQPTDADEKELEELAKKLFIPAAKKEPDIITQPEKDETVFKLRRKVP